MTDIQLTRMSISCGRAQARRMGHRFSAARPERVRQKSATTLPQGEGKRNDHPRVVAGCDIL